MKNILFSMNCVHRFIVSPQYVRYFIVRSSCNNFLYIKNKPAMYRKRTISGRATPGASYVYSGHHKIVSLRARAAHSTKLLYFFSTGHFCTRLLGNHREVVIILNAYNFVCSDNLCNNNLCKNTYLLKQQKKIS